MGKPELDQYVIDALAGFKTDPASTDFQRGYEACLAEIAKVFDIPVDKAAD